MTIRPKVTALLTIVGLAVPAAGLAAPGDTAEAVLSNAEGAAIGTVTFTETPSGVLIRADLTGLPPGEHGFHIHAAGVCEGDFASAGGHFAPVGHGHGFLSEEGPHAGDLPNIFVHEDGTAKAHFLNARITLDDGASGLFDANGASMMVHEHADSYEAEAGAGGRIACGVIEPGS